MYKRKWQIHSALLHGTLFTICIGRYEVGWQSLSRNTSQNANPVLCADCFPHLWFTLRHVACACGQLEFSSWRPFTSRCPSSGFPPNVLVEHHGNHHGGNLQKPRWCLASMTERDRILSFKRTTKPTSIRFTAWILFSFEILKQHSSLYGDWKKQHTLIWGCKATSGW